MSLYLNVDSEGSAGVSPVLSSSNIPPDTDNPARPRLQLSQLVVLVLRSIWSRYPGASDDDKIEDCLSHDCLSAPH